MLLVLIVLLLAIIDSALLLLFVQFGTPPLGPHIIDGQVGQPGEADAYGDGNQGYSEYRHIVAVAGIEYIQPEDDEADDIEGQWRFHEDGDVIGVLIVEGLIEVDADHDEEGEDEEESDGRNWFIGGYSQADGEYHSPDKRERNVH